MKAVVYSAYGPPDGLHLAEVKTPTLGADHVMDYTRDDCTNTGQQYDLILDVVADRSAFAYQRALKPGGTYFAVGGSVATLLQILLLGPWMRRTTGKHIRMLGVQRTEHDPLAIAELCAAGTTLIDAIRYVRCLKRCALLETGVSKAKSSSPWTSTTSPDQAFQEDPREPSNPYAKQAARV